MECSTVRLAYISPNICISFNIKKAIYAHRQTFLLHIQGKDNPVLCREEEAKGTSPGGWWEHLRRKEHRSWQGLEGRIYSSMRLTECCVCQKLIHKQMLIL